MEKQEKKKNNNNEKIVIDKSFDLLKLSYNQMNSVKLSNYSGKYFDELYAEALLIEERETSQNNNILNKSYSDKEKKINKITFSIYYPTVFGEEIGLLGSVPILGNWNQQNIKKLKWNNGNRWTICFDFSSFYDISGFEFKFILLEKGKIKKWQGGENNKINLLQIKKDILEKKFNFYEYREENKELILNNKWK